MNQLSVIFNSDLAYKYEDIKSEWIIHEGNLEYLYGENIFKTTSLFKNYLIVLTCILNDKKENIIVLYLYPDKTKTPYKYFQLEKNDQLNDRCRKIIVGKSGLFFMELIIDKTDKSVIFGARSVPERKLWIQKFNEAISKLKLKPITRSVSDVHSSRPKSSGEECSLTVESRPINYVPFKGDDPKNYIQSKSYTESSTAEYMKPIDDYEEAELVLPEEGKISWDEIFYNNIKNDFTNILINIGQTGIFLVRPQSKKTSLNSHGYTLCVYDNNHIHKFGINQLPDDRYLLTYRENEPSFTDIPQLCQYYITHPLHITVKDGLNKQIYLTFPYTHTNLYY